MSADVKREIIFHLCHHTGDCGIDGFIESDQACAACLIVDLSRERDAALADRDLWQRKCGMMARPVTDGKRVINYEDDGGVMDPECIPICDALNKLPFIETISSCCGHSCGPLRIYFTARNMDALKPILAEIDEWDVWRVRASMATGNMEVYFILEGVMGNEAYAAANCLAARLALPPQGGTG